MFFWWAVGKYFRGGRRVAEQGKERQGKVRQGMI